MTIYNVSGKVGQAYNAESAAQAIQFLRDAVPEFDLTDPYIFDSGPSWLIWAGGMVAALVSADSPEEAIEKVRSKIPVTFEAPVAIVSEDVPRTWIV